MKKLGFLAVMAVTTTALTFMPIQSEAKEKKDSICNGIYVGELDLSGMSAEDAKAEVQGYVDSLMDKEIKLHITGEHQISVRASDLGLHWGNPSVIESASELGKVGNVLQRYRCIKDLEHERQYYHLDLSFDEAKIDQVLTEQCQVFDLEAKDATIKKVEEGFEITEGQEGLALNVAASKELLEDSLENGWNDEEMADIELVAEVTKPRANAEELRQIKDCLGSFTTSYSTSGSNRSGNVANGCSHINGSVIMPGEEYSVYDTVKPFTIENGYFLAGSYLNGQVVDSIGGGICQVSTTLYNAVLKAELEVSMRYNHSMIVNYVDPSADAAIAESSGKDFRFINNTDYPIYIEGYCENKHITMNIYGVETRPANRVVRYESNVLSRTPPTEEKIYQDPGLPVGNISITAAHIGVKAELWKVVTVDGVEQSREQVNSSSYASSPRSCTVGVATGNEGDYNNLMAAIASGSIDQVAAVSNAIRARDEANAAAAAAQAQAQQPQ